MIVTVHDNRVRLRNLLVSRALAGTFWKTAVDPDTGLMSLLNETVTPASVQADEVRGSFGFPKGVTTKSFEVDRTGWQFQLIIAFNEPVDFEEFLSGLSTDIPTVPRDVELGREQHFLRLTSFTPEHPPTQQPSGGSKATLIFEVA